MAQDIAKTFVELEIVSDILDTAPNNALSVKYPSGAIVNAGNELTPTDVQNQPIVSWNAESSATLYTLLFTDPDAPSRETPKMREARHWLVVNIPGNQVAAGDTIVEFIGSGPPQGTGLHRYVFIVFKQNGPVNVDVEKVLKTTTTGRMVTSTRDLMAKYGLGAPVAGNVYQSQYDDYVPILHAQLGFK